MRGLRLLCYSFAFLGLLLSPRPGLAEETIKLAYTDPFSGPFASGGDEFLKNFQYIIARKNAAGGPLGRKYELVPFDDKLQPAEALIAQATAAEQEAVDLYHFTSLLNRTLDEEGRRRMVEMMWQMVYADQQVSEFEDNLIWRAADLLGVSSRDRIELRRRVAGGKEIDQEINQEINREIGRGGGRQTGEET